MKKKHDVHALAMIGLEYFIPDDKIDSASLTEITTMEALIQYFGWVDPQDSSNVRLADPLYASGSPE